MSTQWAAAFIETALVLLAAAFIRVRVIPGFTYVPGKFQMLLEQLVLLTDLLLSALVHLAVGVVEGTGKLVRGTAALIRAIGRGCAALWRTRRNFLVLWGLLLAALLALAVTAPGHGGHGDVSTAMRDAVLHDVNRVSLFGLKAVNPGLIAAFTVTGVLLFLAALLRLLVIPRFRNVPGKFQLVLETIVNTLDGLAKVENPAKRTFIGAYVFAAGVYIFVGTLFELFGLQAVTTAGTSVALPAPLSDVNAAIAMGCGSYLVIVCGGAVKRGAKGIGAALKEFSLPVSMSFRLFGALLSGLLVTELVYHYTALSYVLPVVVAVIFTLLHAIIQSYVLTMLMGIYFHEVTE